MTSPVDVKIDQLRARPLVLRTEHEAESDGTLVWSSTTLVLVELRVAGAVGIGYTYAHASAAPLIQGLLADCVVGEHGDGQARGWLLERMFGDELAGAMRECFTWPRSSSSRWTAPHRVRQHRCESSHDLAEAVRRWARFSC
jgi:hypothetical protein